MVARVTNLPQLMVSRSSESREETQSICEPETVIKGPHQLQSFNFPSRAFGEAKKIHHSFQSKWFDKYKWLHYSEARDAAYCYTCKTADEQKKLRTKYKESSFISRGFTNWKDGTVGFNKHESSECHKEAVQVIEVIPHITQNVGEQLCHIHASNKAISRKMLLKTLQNIMFLARQNIALRGDKDECDSNFNQLLCLRAYDDSNILNWLKKKTDKYTSGDIQNEMLEVMALQVLQNLTSKL